MCLMALCIPWTTAVAELHQKLAFSRPSPEWIPSVQCRIEVSGVGYISPSITIKWHFFLKIQIVTVFKYTEFHTDRSGLQFGCSGPGTAWCSLAFLQWWTNSSQAFLMSDAHYCSACVPLAFEKGLLISDVSLFVHCWHFAAAHRPQILPWFLLLMECDCRSWHFTPLLLIPCTEENFGC